MLRLTRIWRWVASLSLLVFINVQGFDVPTRYRTPLFQPDVTKKIKNWATEFFVRFGSGSTSESFHGDGDTTELFNDHGPFDVVRLGIGLEDITTKPVTNNYWGVGGTFSQLDTLKPTDGKVIFGGHFDITQIDFVMRQNLFWGLYAHIYAPYKSIEIDKISTRNIGAANVLGVNIDEFLSPKGDLPIILSENGLEPFNKPFKESEFSDIVVSLGWHDYKADLECLVTSLGGYMQGGCLIPCASEQDLNKVFAIPLGYNQHTAIVGHGALEVGLWNVFKLGAQGGAIIFFKTDRSVRLKTNKLQNGWIILEKSRAAVEPGTVWNAGGYFKVDQLVKGLAFIIGYSYTKQEETTVHVKDAQYLKTVRQNALDPNTVFIAENAPNAILISQDDVANSDLRLDGWTTQALHFLASYDMSEAIKGGWGPLFKLEYNYPIIGSFSWKTSYFAGSIGFSVAFNF